MLHYAATVRTNQGGRAKYTVKASDRQGAARELSFPPSRVLSVKVDWLTTLRTASSKSGGPSPTEQAVFLLNLSAQLTSGKRSPEGVFKSYLERDKSFRVDQGKFNSAIEVEDFLDALGFSQNVLLMAKAGRVSGNLTEALKNAAEFLQDEEARKGAIAKKISSGIFYSSAALGMVVFGSIGFSNQLRDMERNIGIPFEYNVASEIMFGLSHFFTNYGLFLLVLLGVGLVFRRQLLEAAGGWPILSQINRIIRVQRGISFLSLFSLLRQSGRTDKDALNYMASHSTGIDAEIYNRLASVKARGQPLYTGLDEKNWSPTILAGLGDLEEMDETSALKTMKAILGGQKQELSKAGESLATTLQMTGMISLVATISVVVIGFLLPILSVTTTPDL